MKEYELKGKVAQFNNSANKQVVVSVSVVDTYKQSYIIKEDERAIYRGDENFIDIDACLKHVIEKHGYNNNQDYTKITSEYYIDDNTKLIICEANKLYSEMEAFVFRHEKEIIRRTYSATLSHSTIIDDIVNSLNIDVDANNHERYNNYQPEKP